MNNESKTLRDVCVPRPLSGAGGDDKKSYDTVGELGRRAGRFSCGKHWAAEVRFLYWKEEVIAVATHSAGPLGTVSPHTGCA